MIVKELFADKDYLKKILAISSPLIVTYLVNSAVNLVDNVMIGSFGDTILAADNLVDQYTMLFYMLVIGICSGGSVLNAQYWGKNDLKNLHKVLSIQLGASIAVGLICTLLGWFFPKQILSLYTRDPAVINAGYEYLKIISLSYFPFSIYRIITAAHRSTGNTRLPMVVSVLSLVLNVILNYILIFGKLGFPSMGLKGAAISTIFAQFFNLILLVFLTYRKKMPVMLRFDELFVFDKQIFQKAIKQIIPVVASEEFWGLGLNVYYSIYGHISTAAVAAMAAIGPIDNLMFTFLMAFGDGAAVLIGNAIGADEKDRAFRYSEYAITLSFMISIVLGFLIFGSRSILKVIYNLSPASMADARTILLIMALTILVRGMNYTILIGVIRPGGDTRFGLINDTGIMWMVGIPAAWILANIFHQPIQIVYLGTVLEEVTKAFLCVRRFISRKWLNNLVKEDL